jgi:hypothetical protein
MKNLWFSPLVLAMMQLEAAPVFPPGQTPADMAKIVTFLTSTGGATGGTGVGLTITATAAPLAGLIIPVSYYSSPAYWITYVGQNASMTFINTTDIYNSPAGSFNLSPIACSSVPPLPFPIFLCPGDFQIERTNGFVGADIYDAAVWQIALALAGNDGYTGPGGASLFTILNNQTALLYNGTYPDQVTASGVLRGVTQGNTFQYGGKSITNPQNAYFFRLIPPRFIDGEPLYYYCSESTSCVEMYLTYPNLPPPQPCSPSDPNCYFPGSITWHDFKPITGENAWAFLLGPLQAALIQQQSTGASYVDFTSTAVQNAVNVLLAFQYMQSPIGALWYITSNTLGNSGPVDQYTVSTENNFSVLGGLFTLQRILTGELANQPGLTSTQIGQINSSLAAIQAMIYGGTLAGGTQTAGMLSFLKNYAWNAAAGLFHHSGLANDPSQSSVWVVPAGEDQAVDVGTWGVACLGQPLIDSWFGFGSAYNIWASTKVFGGYYGPDGTLWGVGFSSEDGNGPCSGGSTWGVISGEWTFGAINMVRALITQYGNVIGNTEHYTQEERDAAVAYVASLQADQASMLANVLTLRTDNYPTTAAYNPVMPPNYNQLMYGGSAPTDRLAFLYANRRYQIPFGWISNPIPSQASTGWSVFLYYNFNPFNPIGTYDPNPALNVLPSRLTRFQQIYDLQKVKDERQLKINQITGNP